MGNFRSTRKLLLDHIGGHDAWQRDHRNGCFGVVADRSLRGVATGLLQKRPDDMRLRGHGCGDRDRWTLELLRCQSESHGLSSTATKFNAIDQPLTHTEGSRNGYLRNCPACSRVFLPRIRADDARHRAAGDRRDPLDPWLDRPPRRRQALLVLTAPAE